MTFVNKKFYGKNIYTVRSDGYVIGQVGANCLHGAKCVAGKEFHGPHTVELDEDATATQRVKEYSCNVGMFR